MNFTLQKTKITFIEIASPRFAGFAMTKCCYMVLRITEMLQIFATKFAVLASL